MVELKDNSLCLSVVIVFVDTAFNAIIIDRASFNKNIFCFVGNKKTISTIMQYTITDCNVVSGYNIDRGSIACIVDQLSLVIVE